MDMGNKFFGVRLSPETIAAIEAKFPDRGIVESIKLILNEYLGLGGISDRSQSPQSEIDEVGTVNELLKEVYLRIDSLDGRVANLESRNDIATDIATDTTPDTTPDIATDTTPDITTDTTPDITMKHQQKPDTASIVEVLGDVPNDLISSISSDIMPLDKDIIWIRRKSGMQLDRQSAIALLKRFPNREEALSHIP
jgi:hypothetical protein